MTDLKKYFRSLFLLILSAGIANCGDLLDLTGADPEVNSAGENPLGGGEANTVSQTISICSVQDLNSIRSNPSANYKLTCDIDLSGSGFTPIGEYFMGTFDGQNHTIRGFTYTNNRSDSNVGLFKTMVGTVKNLTLDTFTISAGSNVGALAGTSGGTINSVKLIGTNRIEAGSTAGGLVGWQTGGSIISSSVSNTTVTTNVAVLNGNNAQFGGLVGDSRAEIRNCSASNINLDAPARVGGLVGMLWGNLNSNGARIVESYAKGMVSGDDMVGGLVGYQMENASISSSYAMVNITGRHSAIGGLVGWTSDSNSPIALFHAKISESYSIGKLTVGSSVLANYVGGFVGRLDRYSGVSSIIERSAWLKDSAYSYNSTLNSLGSSSSTGEVGIVPLTFALFGNTASFANWSQSVWNISPGNYPNLKNTP